MTNQSTCQTMPVKLMKSRINRVVELRTNKRDNFDEQILHTPTNIRNGQKQLQKPQKICITTTIYGFQNDQNDRV